jgi:mono/diheme cytochrome c family protein
MKMRPTVSVFAMLVFASQFGCRKPAEAAKVEPQQATYDSELDWADSQKIIPLGYQQAQGKRVFYQYCVWCHADATPAGPSNRSNLTPVPALLNDGSVLNSQSDEYMQNIITLGGSAMGKSAMMPPYGHTLTSSEIRAVIAFTRAIAQPAYEPLGRPGSQYSAK